MLTSIAIADFIDPPRGSRPFNAIRRAIDAKPDVVLIGTYEGEKYYRVQRPKGDRHCVQRWANDYGEEQAKCDCEAHIIPQDPTPCLHIAAVLIYESQEQDDERPSRTPRKKGTLRAIDGGAGADQVKRRTGRRVRARVE